MLSSPFEKLNKQITNTKAISDLHYLTNKTQKLIKIHCYILKILFKRGVNLFDIGKSGFVQSIEDLEKIKVFLH